MNVQWLVDHLALTERHVAGTTLHVERQRQLVKDLACDGHDVTASFALPRLFERLLELHLQDRDRTVTELVAATKRSPGIDSLKESRYGRWVPPNPRIS